MPSLQVLISGGCLLSDSASCVISGSADNSTAEIASGVCAEVDAAGDSTVVAAVLGGGRAGAIVAQTGFDVDVGGVLVDHSLLSGEISVEQDIDRLSQTFLFTVALQDADGVFGNPLVRGAPSTGITPITIYATYRVGGAIQRFPLLTGGVADTSRRIVDFSVGSRQGKYQEISGLDRGGFYDGIPCTLVIPPGSGLTRAQVTALLLAQIGETQLALENTGIAINKEVQAVDADPYSLSQEMWDVEGRRLMYDCYGFLANPRRGLMNNPDAGLISLDLDETLTTNVEQLEEDCPGDVPTDVTLTGTQQLISPPTAAPVHTNSTQTTKVYTWTSVPIAYFEQALDGTLSALGGAVTPAALILTQVQVTISEYLGSTLVKQVVETYSYYWPEAARYSWDEGTHSDAFQPDVFLPQGAVASDQTIAYATRTPQWLLTSRVTTGYYYDAPGYTGPDGLSTDPWFLAFHGTQGGAYPGTGYKLGSIATTEGYYLPRAAFKAAETGTAWEAIDPINGVLLRGSGEAVAQPAATWVTTAADVEVLSTDANGRVVSDLTYHYGFSLFAGSAFYYQNNNATSDESVETFQLTGWDLTTYASLDENTYQQLDATFTYNGITGTETAAKSSTGPGAGPAADMVTGFAPDPSLYANPSDIKNASLADPSQTQPMKVKVPALGLLGTHVPKYVKTSLAWAETPADLEAAGLYLIEQSAAIDVTFTVPLLGMVVVPNWVSFTYRPLGYLSVPMQVTKAKHYTNGQATDQYLSQITLTLYPNVAGALVQVGTDGGDDDG